MRVFYDTEFIENGSTIDLISIALVAEDGREYYAVNADMDVDRIREHSWLRENVWPHLPVGGLQRKPVTVGGRVELRVTSPGHLDTGSTLVRPRWVIRNEVREFLAATPDVELWADYGAYDHVVLCQLFGPMIHLPDGVPMFTHDIQQLAGDRTDLPEQPSTQHNALSDARWVADLHSWLTGDITHSEVD